MDSGILATVALDFPVGWFIFFMGGNVALLILFILIVYLEARVLTWCDYTDRRRALALSAAMNIISSLVGFLVARQIAPLPGRYGLGSEIPPMPEYYAGVPEIFEWFLFTDSRGIGIPDVVVFLLVSLLLSVVSEGVVIWAANRSRRWQENGFVTLATNGASYAFLFSLYLCWRFIASLFFFTLDLIEYWPFILLFAILFIGIHIKRMIQSATGVWAWLFPAAVLGMIWGVVTRFTFYPAAPLWQRITFSLPMQLAFWITSNYSFLLPAIIGAILLGVGAVLWWSKRNGRLNFSQISMKGIWSTKQ